MKNTAVLPAFHPKMKKNHASACSFLKDSFCYPWKISWTELPQK